MPKKIVNKLIPNVEKLSQRKGFSLFARWLSGNPHLFSIQRKRVALGFALGIAIGVIPLPIQVFLSIFLCIIFEASIPATILAAIVMNPLTYPLVLALALQIGGLVYGQGIQSVTLPDFSLLFSSPDIWFLGFSTTINQVGAILMWGIPVTGLLLGFLSYWFIRFTWYWVVVYQWTHRPWRKQQDQMIIDSVQDNEQICQDCT